MSAGTPKFESSAQLCQPSRFLIVLLLSVVKMYVVENSQPSIVCLFMCLFLTLSHCSCQRMFNLTDFNYLGEIISVPVFLLLLDKKSC